MVSSGSISMRGLHFRASEVKVMGCERVHQYGMVCALVKKQWPGESECSQAFRRNTLNVLPRGGHESLTLGARASGNGWEHVRNIEGTGSIYLACFH